MKLNNVHKVKLRCSWQPVGKDDEASDANFTVETEKSERWNDKE